MGGSKIKINKKIYDITPDIQKVKTDTPNILLKKLKKEDRETFINLLERFDYEN